MLRRKVFVNGVWKFPCTKCPRSYLRWNSLLKHLRLECGKEPQFCCTLCDKKVYQKIHLKYHMMTQHNAGQDVFSFEANGAIPVQDADVTTDFSEDFVVMLFMNAAKIPNFVAHYGQDVFSFEANGAIPVQDADGTIDFSGAFVVIPRMNVAKIPNFLVVFAAESRILTRGEWRFPCPDCGRTYRFYSGVYRHRRLECGKEPQFACDRCDKRFSQKDNLKSHYAR
ncbi:unnamed protein product, partial [Cyprideis torosa]